MKQKYFKIAGGILVGAIVFLAGAVASQYFQFLPFTNSELMTPFVSQTTIKNKPLLAYTINNLSQRKFEADSELKIIESQTSSSQSAPFIFSYTTLNKNMSGRMTVPKQYISPASQFQTNGLKKKLPVIIMLRGWVPPENYSPGVGTKNMADYFSENGYVTLAPDFFGFGLSDSEPENSWEARFVKPINVIELIKTIQDNPLISLNPNNQHQTIQLDPTRIGIWGHSNGGQIALTTLEIMSQPIPTALWAPVTAPFPYSITFFSDENEDEGKELRAWLALFEKDYDSLEFSISQHLDKLHGPIQIHHGSNDEAALQTWSDEFVNKINLENKKRQAETEEATPGAKVISSTIEVNYFVYPGGDHNLQPATNWNLAAQRDLLFFEKELGK